MFDIITSHVGGVTITRGGVRPPVVSRLTCARVHCSAQLAGKMSTSNGGGGGEEDEDEPIDDDEILRTFQQSQLSQSRLSLIEFLSE